MSSLNKRILIVDDDTDDQLLLEEALISLGMRGEIRFASNGVEAIKYVESQPPFQLIFLDLNMPKLSGWDTLRIIQKKDEKVPVYILSTSCDERDRLKCIQLGAKGFITKPVIFENLCIILEDVLKEEFS